jgi:scyllo-inositol 2-dehydrogenase (NAD+)
MTGAKRVGVGVVGTGGWARGFWQGGRESPEVQVVACWDPVEEHAARFVEQYGGEAMPSLDALLAHRGVEAVAIFTPNNHHRAPAEQAAAAGKHVFVDKPIANTFADGVAMVEACERAGVTLMVGHSTRYQPVNRAMKQALEAGELGQLVMVEGHTSHSGGSRLSDREWRWHWEEAPGGPLMQLSVHVYDTLHYFFGATKQVTAFAKSDLFPSEIEDVFLTLLEFESGLLAYVGTNYLAPPAGFLRVYGRAGNLYSEGGKLTHLKPVNDWQVGSEGVPIPEGNAHAAEMSEFARALRTETPPETGGREALLALGVVWAAIESVRRGRPVEVREAMGPAAALV